MTHYRKILCGLLIAIVSVFTSCSKDGRDQYTPEKQDKADNNTARTELYENVNFQDGEYNMYLYNSSLVVEISGGWLGEALAQTGQYNAGITQRMRLTSLGSGFYKITAVHSGLVLTVIDNPLAEGSRIQQAEWKGDAFQQWRFVNIGDGYVAIVSRHSSLGIHGYGPAGTPLVQRAAQGTWPSYKWRVWKI
ncbi:RICIN domain-containing protein [Chitinophaga solisilvae]|uniref:RICIN domain-containing protein n=1 Tax=Chitinophaga solisilvae TaxID=1233460 RepID=UPI00136C6224|nr:RICIN domain-containing protein [Chitinophaga solisilvae]